MHTVLRLLFASLVLVVFSFVGLQARADGGQAMPMTTDQHDAGPADPHDDAFAFGMPGHARDATRTVRVDMMDNAYSLRTLSVRSGETVRFLIKNNDDFTHEFVIGPADMMVEHRAEMMDMFDKGMDMETMMHDDPNAVTIPAMQTRAFVWTFADAGEIEFACTLPGHYEAGMHGDIEITDPH